MTLNEKKTNPDAAADTDDSIPELPHPPHLPSPEPVEKVEADSPTSAGSTPNPHFPAPGHLDPPI